ncbi:MAG TPA: cytochrome P450 [Xanthobacteraceae bacterium]|nr:cytochrome P450 [Xanthobacteraceae bacterium]
MQFARDPLLATRRVFDAFGPFVSLSVGLPLVRRSRTVLLGVPLMLTAGAAFQRELFSDQETWRGVSVLPGGPKGSAARRISAGLTRLTGARHAHYRKLVQTAMRRTNVEAAAARMAQIMQAEIARWPLDAAIDLSEHIRQLMRGIIVEFLFGGDSAETRAIAELTSHITEHKWARSAFALPVNLPITTFGRILRESELLERRILEWAASKRGTIDEADLGSIIVNSPDADGNPPGDDTIVSQLASLFALSSEGSESVLIWTLLLVQQHPAVTAALRDELHARLGRKSPSLDQTGDLPYLDAVVKESMRILPPVPLLIRVAQRDTTIAGHAVPQGTRAILNTFLTNRMPDVYPEGHLFRPERWFTVTPSAFEFPVFGAGARACPGHWFGSSAVKIALAGILTHGQLDLPSDTRIDYRVQPTMRPRQSIRAIFHRNDGIKPTAAPVSGTIRALVDFPH